MKFHHHLFGKNGFQFQDCWRYYFSTQPCGSPMASEKQINTTTVEKWFHRGNSLEKPACRFQDCWRYFFNTAMRLARGN